MTHEQAHPLLLELAYGDLDPEAAVAVRSHADGCAACTTELAAIATTRAFAATRDADVAPGHRRELVEAARRAVTPSRRRWSVRRRTTAWIATAAVIAIVGGVTVQVVSERSRRVVESTAAPAPPEPAPGRGAATASVPGPPVRSESAPRSRERATAAEPPRAPASAPKAEIAGAGRNLAGAPAAPAPARPASRGQDLADSGAPERQRDRSAQRSAPTVTDPAAPSRSVVADVERRAAAGDLSTAERRLRCEGENLDRSALVTPDGRIVRLTVRRNDRPPVDGWYGEDGTLRALRTHDADGRPIVSFVDESSHPSIPRELPVRAPTLEVLGSRCAW